MKKEIDNELCIKSDMTIEQIATKKKAVKRAYNIQILKIVCFYGMFFIGMCIFIFVFISQTLLKIILCAFMTFMLIAFLNDDIEIRYIGFTYQEKSKIEQLKMLKNYKGRKILKRAIREHRMGTYYLEYMYEDEEYIVNQDIIGGIKKVLSTKVENPIVDLDQFLYIVPYDQDNQGE